LPRWGRGYPTTGLVQPGGAPPVSYDATGAGNKAVSGSSISWSHTIAGNYVVAYAATGASTPTTVTATCGGVSMTLLAKQGYNNTGTNGSLYMFGLFGPGSGAKTITVTFSTAPTYSLGNSVSYKNVVRVGTPVAVYGNSSTVSNTMTCLPNQMLINGFGEYTATSFTSPSGGTTRYNDVESITCCLIQDSGASTTFSANMASAYNWAGIGAVLY
jgi:hypothetical protein